MGAILKRELSSYFNSAIAYVVLAAYFFFSGVFFYNYCIVYNSASLSYVYGNMLDYSVYNSDYDNEIFCR